MLKGKNREKRKKKEGPLEPSSGAHPNLTRLLAYSCMPVDASPFFLLFTFFLYFFFFVSSYSPGLFVFYFFFHLRVCFACCCVSVYFLPHLRFVSFPSSFSGVGWVGGIFFHRGTWELVRG